MHYIVVGGDGTTWPTKSELHCKKVCDSTNILTLQGQHDISSSILIEILKMSKCEAIQHAIQSDSVIA